MVSVAGRQVLHKRARQIIGMLGRRLQFFGRAGNGQRPASGLCVHRDECRLPCCRIRRPYFTYRSGSRQRRRRTLGDAQKLMTRLGEGHGLRLFPFPRAFPVIASVATPEPRRRRPQANVTPIPNRCQLEPIASPCRFEHFQALARSTGAIGHRGRSAEGVAGARGFRPGGLSNSEWRIVRSASPFAIRYSPSASYQHAQPF